MTEAERQQRVDAARRVADGLLHEVRNVLNPITSAAWLIEAHATNPQKVGELARRIAGFADANGRLSAKLQELLRDEAAGAAGDSAPFSTRG
jgi:nitrogen-specific signal transduction histidine kinase